MHVVCMSQSESKKDAKRKRVKTYHMRNLKTDREIEEKLERTS